MSVADELAKLYELKTKGAITESEYNDQKAVLLSGLKSNLAQNASMPPDDIEIRPAPAQTNGPKPADRSATKQKGRGLLWKIPVGLVGLVIAISAIYSLADYTDPPSCTSSDARDAVEDAYAHNAISGIATLRLLDLADVTEVSFDETTHQRTCSGTAVLNSGRSPIRFTLSLTSDHSLLVEVKRQ